MSLSGHCYYNWMTWRNEFINFLSSVQNKWYWCVCVCVCVCVTICTQPRFAFVCTSKDVWHLKFFSVARTVEPPNHRCSLMPIVLCYNWACYYNIKLFLSQYLTNLMHKICFTISFISCLYMFRAHVLITRRSKLRYTASGIITPIGVMIPEAV